MRSSLESVTFFLALLGYAGLAATTVMASRARSPNALWRATAGTILLHVLMVWHGRYEWRLSEATRDGYGGFVLFHGALAAILASTLTPFRTARILVTAAFFVVSLGAIAATAKYDVVAVYRIPVLLIATSGLVAMTLQPARAFLARRAR